MSGENNSKHEAECLFMFLLYCSGYYLTEFVDIVLKLLLYS